VRIRIPEQLCSERSTLRDRLNEMQSTGEAGSALPREILALLPDDLVGAPAFLESMTRMWRYEYGEAYENIGGHATMYGTDQCPSVDRLVRVLRCAQRHLDEGQLKSYLSLLTQRSRHDEALAEFTPVLRLPEDVSLTYETKDYSPNGKTVDWFIDTHQGRPMLLEVKCRKRDLLDNTAQILANPGATPAEFMPRPQSERLFDDVEAKFLARSSKEILQGVWIRSPIAQHRDSLEHAFDDLDHSKVHFAVLANSSAEAYVLSRESADRDHILETFELTQSDRFIIADGAAG